MSGQMSGWVSRGRHMEEKVASGWLSELVCGWIVDEEMAGCQIDGGPIMDKW